MISEKIRILLVKRGNISEAEFARKLGMSPQNLYSKMKRDNFSEKEMRQMADVLDCSLNITFTLNDTKEVL